jgi:hypothetical protein
VHRCGNGKACADEEALFHVTQGFAIITVMASRAEAVQVNCKCPREDYEQQNQQQKPVQREIFYLFHEPPCILCRKGANPLIPEKKFSYTISKKSVTKQRTELGIGNWEFGIRNSKKSLLPPEPRIMMN